MAREIVDDGLWEYRANQGRLFQKLNPERDTTHWRVQLFWKEVRETSPWYWLATIAAGSMIVGTMLFFERRADAAFELWLAADMPSIAVSTK